YSHCLVRSSSPTRRSSDLEPHTHLLTCRGRSESATRDHQLHRSVLHEHAYVFPGRDRGRRRDRRLDEELARREWPSRYPAEHVVGPRVCRTSPCDTALARDMRAVERRAAWNVDPRAEYRYDDACADPCARHRPVRTLELDDVAPTGTIAADVNAILCAHSRHRR